MTPERLAAMEAAAARAQDDPAPSPAPAPIDEELSPVAGRRFTRA
jgi:hypothetical protein